MNVDIKKLKSAINFLGGQKATAEVIGVTKTIVCYWLADKNKKHYSPCPVSKYKLVLLEAKAKGWKYDG